MYAVVEMNRDDDGFVTIRNRYETYWNKAEAVADCEMLNDRYGGWGDFFEVVEEEEE